MLSKGKFNIYFNQDFKIIQGYNFYRNEDKL